MANFLNCKKPSFIEELCKIACECEAVLDNCLNDFSDADHNNIEHIYDEKYIKEVNVYLDRLIKFEQQNKQFLEELKERSYFNYYSDYSEQKKEIIVKARSVCNIFSWKARFKGPSIPYRKLISLLSNFENEKCSQLNSFPVPSDNIFIKRDFSENTEKNDFIRPSTSKADEWSLRLTSLSNEAKRKQSSMNKPFSSGPEQIIKNNTDDATRLKLNPLSSSKVRYTVNVDNSYSWKKKLMFIGIILVILFFLYWLISNNRNKKKVSK